MIAILQQRVDLIIQGVRININILIQNIPNSVTASFPVSTGLASALTMSLRGWNREIRRRTRVVGSFPDGNSALMLVCARLRHVAGTQWGNKKYMNMKHLEATLEDASIAG